MFQFDRALKVKPYDLEATISKGKVLLALGKTNEGLIMEMAGGVFSFDINEGISLKSGI
jgi:hypothetical protein